MRRHVRLYTLLLGGLAACQAGMVATSKNVARQAELGKASTTVEAIALVKKHLSQLPGHEIYLLDQATAADYTYDKGRSWLVFVPRADRVNFKPSGSAFRVDKASGDVSPYLLK